MKTRAAFRFAATVAAAWLACGAHAQLFRAYLSVDGADTNPCTLAQPCRLLPAALNAVAHEGEVWILDSGNFNTATVSVGKSVTILAVPGAVGSVVSIGGPAIELSSGGVEVGLRNLVIGPWPGSTSYGILFTGASALTLEGCTIAGQGFEGIYLLGTGTLNVSDTLFRGNAGNAMLIYNGGTANVSRSRFIDNAGSIVATAAGDGTVTRVTIAGSLFSGGSVAVQASAVAGGHAFAQVTESTIVRSGTALKASADATGAATVSFSASTIAHNDAAWSRTGAGAALRTLGNNHFSDNGVGTGALTPLSPQ